MPTSSLPPRADVVPPVAPQVAVIGGDRRMLHAARRLSLDGAAVTLLGQGDLLSGAPGLRAVTTLEEALRDTDVILLPLPASRDGVTVNCPFSPNLSLSLADIAARMRENPSLRLFGGKLPAAFSDDLSSISDNGFPRVVDYFEDERLTLRNAYLTAEGALILAGRESDHALAGASAVILGYGRIGKLLARLLRAMGTEVTVVARRREALLWAEADGCHPLHMRDALRATGAVEPLGGGCPLVFNTVPERLLGLDFLLRLAPDTRLFDLASPPYVTSEEDARVAARRNALHYIRAPGIPGTYAPRDAGYAIADCVADALGMTDFDTTDTDPKGDPPL